MKYSVVIVAAGKGSRMKLGYNKVYAPLPNGKAILAETMSIFQQDEDCTEIIVVTEPETFLHMTKGHWPSKVVVASGGATRQESVSHGLMAVKEDIVMIHDGARPYLDKDSLSALKKTMETEEAACLSMPCKDTIAVVKDGYIYQALDRSTLCAAQTPQVFRTSLIMQCMRKAVQEHFVGTDDCSLVMKWSQAKIAVVEGSYANKKITTPEDL